METISITGSSGFIGKHLVRALTKQNYNLNLLSRNNLSTSTNTKNYINFDLNKKYKNCYKKIGSPDKLIHLAWGGIPHYQSKYHIEKELGIQYRFLSNCIENGLKNIIVSGTCLEYGFIEGKLSENMKVRPNVPYGKAKYILYKKIIKLQKKFKFNLIWARIFYVYGNNQTHKTIYSELINSIKKNHLYFNMSPGNQIRDYIHVSDLVEIFIKFIKSNSNIGIVNVCSGKKIHLKTIVKKWIKEKNSLIKLNLGYYDYNTYEPKDFYGSSTKLNRILKSKQ